MVLVTQLLIVQQIPISPVSYLSNSMVNCLKSVLLIGLEKNGVRQKLMNSMNMFPETGVIVQLHVAKMSLKHNSIQEPLFPTKTLHGRVSCGFHFFQEVFSFPICTVWTSKFVLCKPTSVNPPGVNPPV